MPPDSVGDQVDVNVSASIIPGGDARPDWQPGTIVARLPDERYRVRLENPTEGRPEQIAVTADELRRR